LILFQTIGFRSYYHHLYLILMVFLVHIYYLVLILNFI